MGGGGQAELSGDDDGGGKVGGAAVRGMGACGVEAVQEGQEAKAATAEVGAAVERRRRTWPRYRWGARAS